MPNQLIDETSPYLLQHAHNPVDWHPWGDEALQKAREQDKPIFLSIGYSACHWCHVMERESFEDADIAAYLNEHFVSIKVDREERPDLDNIYMNAVQVMSGHGGWPMSVFLTPELEPFYAGTYFPPEDKYGRPGFKTVLEQLVQTWEDDSERARDIGNKITERLEQMSGVGKALENISLEPMARAYAQLDQTFDSQHGGFGRAPKFPPSSQLRLLMHVYDEPTTSDARKERALEMVETTLARMASGGMYDQIGGGFHRYSVDEEWLIPHFEKMLYDNALLTTAYVDAFRLTGRDFYARIVRETLDYVLREMVDRTEDDLQPFFSTQDADTEGEEGKFFVWTPDELEDVLGEEDARRAAEYFGVIEGGNFEHGKSALSRLHALDRGGHEAAYEPIPDDIREIKERLFEAREQRVRPATDEKIIAAWNGMMIGAMARAGFALDEPKYTDAAASAADFLLEEMVQGDLDADFDLKRTYKDGRARFSAYLDDYAWLATGLLDLFEATGELARLAQAQAIVRRMNELFWDGESHGEGGGFYYTAEHHRDLIVRQKEIHDGATPSANSIAVMALLRLATIDGEEQLRERADLSLRAFYPRMMKIPQGLTEMIHALDFHLSGPTEVVLVSDDGEFGPLADALRQSYLANAVELFVDRRDADAWEDTVPLTVGRTARDGQPTAYVCYDRTCQNPTADVAEFRELVE
ncbi:MAG: thioredoxin domain-containing protein [Myxococcota bacterium]